MTSPNEFIANLALGGFWDDYCPECDAQTPHDEGDCQVCVEDELSRILSAVSVATERDSWPWVYEECETGKVHSSPPENVMMTCYRVHPSKFREMFPGEGR